MAQLILKRLNEEDLIIPVDKSLTTVGRSMDNDIAIDEIKISRHHLRIENKNGQFQVKDLNSTNGTYVNGKKIIKTTLLQNLDILSIGTSSLCFMDDRLDSEPINPSETMNSLTSSLSGTNMTFCYLEVIHPPTLCNKYKVEKTHVVLGRDKECDIVIRDITCAKRHAQVTYTGKEFKIQDLGWNGTVVNGKATKEHTLHENDIIELGKVKIRFLPAIKKPTTTSIKPKALEPVTKAMHEQPQSNIVEQRHYEMNQIMDKPQVDPFMESLGKSRIIHLNIAEKKSRKEGGDRPPEGNRDKKISKQEFAKPVKENKIELVSSNTSDIYHQSSCRLAREIKERKRVIFASIEEAIESGRHACGICKPGVNKKKVEDMLKKLFDDVESLKQQAEKMANMLEDKDSTETDV